MYKDCKRHVSASKEVRALPGSVKLDPWPSAKIPRVSIVVHTLSVICSLELEGNQQQELQCREHPENPMPIPLNQGIYLKP